MSDILQIGLAIGVLIVYLLFGLFLSGLMGPDEDDPIMDTVFALFWPVIIPFALLLGLVFWMMSIVECPFDFVKGLGKKLANKIKSVFEKKQQAKINRHYIEHDTRCDKCEHLQECLKDDVLLDITKTNDSRKHYIRAMGVECKVDKETLKAAIEKMGYPEGY